MAEKDRKNFFKEWLETLQQESWQLELLISGLALFGIFESKSFLVDFSNYIDVQFFSNRVRSILTIFLFILQGAWYIFIINLIIHIILRGLWIGAIGLRYVSEDIEYDKLKLSPYFRKLFTKRYQSFDDYIEELERICSVMFAYTFLLFFILISASLFLFWPVVLAGLIDQEAIAVGMALLYFFFGFLVFLDFIFLNPFKKIDGKWFSRIYGFIFRFFSTITLSFLFRPLLLNFLDNKFTRRLFLFSIPYGVLIILILPKVTSETHKYFPILGQRMVEKRAYNAGTINRQLYDNLRPQEKKEKIEHISIRSDVFKSRLFQFFLTMKNYDDSYLQDVLGIEPLHESGFFTGFTNIRSTSTELDSIEQIHVQRVLQYLKEKDENKGKRPAKDWDLEKSKIDRINDKELKVFYEDRLRQITDAIIDNSKFYIDDEIINDKLQCFFAEHENLGEKGWNCYTFLDSLENGIHMFRIERGTYAKNKSLKGSFDIEFPFILDANQN